MKRFFSFVLVLLSLFSLSSCSLFESNSNKVSVDNYEYIISESSDDDIISTISSVEDSCVTVSYALTTFSKETYISGVIFKKVLNIYYVLTSSDISNGSLFKVYFDSNTSISASVLGYDSKNNIGIVYFTSLSNYSVANLINYEASIGEEVFSITTYKRTNSSLSEVDYDLFHKGIISRSDSRRLQHTALSSSKECGSGLFDLNGNLIGINIEKLEYVNQSERINGMNYAIYGSALNKVIDDIFEIKGQVKRYGLTCTYVVVNKYLDTSITFPDDSISMIHITSMAGNNIFKNILKSGDYIYMINDTYFIDSDSFLDVLCLLRTDESVTFGILRGNQKLSVSYN